MRVKLGFLLSPPHPFPWRAEPPFVLLKEEEKRRETLPESRKVFEVTAARISGLVNIVLSGQTIVKLFFYFSSASISLLITKSAVPSARLLGLGSKLYPSKIQRMLNKGSSRVSLE